MGSLKALPLSVRFTKDAGVEGAVLIQETNRLEVAVYRGRAAPPPPPPEPAAYSSTFTEFLLDYEI